MASEVVDSGHNVLIVLHAGDHVEVVLHLQVAHSDSALGRGLKHFNLHDRRCGRQLGISVHYVMLHCGLFGHHGPFVKKHVVQLLHDLRLRPSLRGIQVLLFDLGLRLPFDPLQLLLTLHEQQGVFKLGFAFDSLDYIQLLIQRLRNRRHVQLHQLNGLLGNDILVSKQAELTELATVEGRVVLGLEHVLDRIDHEVVEREHLLLWVQELVADNSRQRRPVAHEVGGLPAHQLVNNVDHALYILVGHFVAGNVDHRNGLAASFYLEEQNLIFERLILIVAFFGQLVFDVRYHQLHAQLGQV